MVAPPPRSYLFIEVSFCLGTARNNHYENNEFCISTLIMIYLRINESMGSGASGQIYIKFEYHLNTSFEYKEFL